MPALLSGRAKNASGRLQEARAELSAKVQEAVEATRELKAFTADGWLAQRIDPAFREILRRHLRLEGVTAAQSLNVVLYWGVVSLVYWLGGRQVLAGQLSVGQLVALVAYFGLLEVPVNRLAGAYVYFQTAAGSAERLSQFLDSPIEVDTGTAVPDTGRGASAAFREVSFTYPGAERPALCGLSFEIAPGAKVAIVGPSGAGKSTLVGLLLRFYDPEAGQVMMGGRDLREYRLGALRQAISIVFQEPFLLDGSVHENIALGCPDATRAEVRQAARAADADGFVRQMEGGYDTRLGERGARLSVGQKQRIAIARLFLRDPCLLILDEATSALDVESEHLVNRALNRLMAGRTAFVIAHRLETVVGADAILVLSAGRLIAQGRHRELLTTCPLYARLVRRQFRESTVEASC